MDSTHCHWQLLEETFESKAWLKETFERKASSQLYAHQRQNLQSLSWFWVESVYGTFLNALSRTCILHVNRFNVSWICLVYFWLHHARMKTNDPICGTVSTK